MDGLVWKGSHRARLANTGKYYELTSDELCALQERCPEQLVPMSPGDVMVMVGGRLVHGSPAISAGQPARWATYAHFK